MVENRNETANENQNEMTETEKRDPEELAEKTEAAVEAEASGENPPDEGAAPSGEPEQMVEIVGLRFKKSGKIYFFDPAGIVCPRETHGIVETARGIEYGRIVISNRMVPVSTIVPPLRRLIRLATPEDERHHAENLAAEQEAFRVCMEKIEAHKMQMKLVDVEYTFDNNKLLFYFTADGRVDFRELVKDLASVFRTRIELRQIGIRDEAKLRGGLGVCGRSYCCHSFLSDFAQVSIKMAKEQNLSLNSAKISGACGRLMCCLRYENDVYEEEANVFFHDFSGHIVEDDTLARLISMPNVIVTSHQAFLTREALSNIAATTLNNIQGFLKDGLSPNEVCYKCEKLNSCNQKHDKKCF